MKFGKQIQIQQITEWQNHYMSYKGLKKIINSLIQEKAQTSVTIAASPPPGSAPPPPPEDDYSKFLQSQKAAFFFKLERELEKVNSFYLQKETELKVRLRSLIDKEKVLLSRQGRPGSSSSINSLKEAYRQFEQDLNKLQKFVETNGTGFRKILKKWDKRSKSSTKELYLSRQVELQPCFNQDTMVELADLAAYHLLGLENIQHSNSSRPSSTPPSPISTKPPQSLPLHHPSSPVQQQMDELETDLFNAMMTNQASRVQEILGRRLITPSPLQSAGVAIVDASGASGVASGAGGSGGNCINNNNQLGPENAREVVSHVFWRCCSEAAIQDHVIQSLVATELVNFRFVDDINDRTCLHEAAMAGRLSLLKLCVENGVNPDCVDVYGRRPLHYVSMYGHAECATYLLSLQVSVSAADHDGFKPLIYSVMNGHSACVEIFLAHGVEIEAAQEGDPIPLSLACHYGHEDIAMKLIERGANIHASNADGLEPLHITCREGHTRLVEILTARGARLDQEDKYMCWTPLFYAASEGHADCVKILLAAGCNVNVLDELGKTPIYYAASEGHADCVELLVEAGGKIEGSKVNAPSSSSAANNNNEDTEMEGMSVNHSLTTSKPATGTASVQSGLGLGPSAFDAKGVDDLDMDCIPSLSLPPPIIPFRIYGHNYLDKKYQVNLVLGHPSFPQHKFVGGKMISSHQAPVHLYGTAQISSLKLIISSRPDNGMIPHNVILPLGDEREVFGFQVDSLEHFTVEFDIYPTFGSKAIGRAVALPSMFNSLESSVGRGTLPLFDAHLKVVGELSFEYSVIRPFEGVRLEVGGRVETYWKSTNSIDSSISTATTPLVGTPSAMPLSASNSSGVLPHPGGTTSALVGNMIPSFITASSLSGEYIQLSIQMTRDFVPVVYAGWYLPVDGFELALCDVTFQQFKRFGEILHQRAMNEDLEGVPTKLANSWTSGEWRQKVYERWMSLEQVLKILPKHVGVNLELKYPTLSERSYYRLTNAADLNKFVDTILQTVYDCSATHHRSVMFSSFNPMICSALNWKQPNYAVFFSTYCGYNKVRLPAAVGALPSPNSSEEEAASKKRKEPTAGSSQLDDSLPSPKQIITSAVPLSEVNSRGQSTNIVKPLSSSSTSSSHTVNAASSSSSSSTASGHNNTAATERNQNRGSALEEEQQKWFHEDDKRCTSIKEAVKFARSNNLLGVICEATPLIQVPGLITHIKESGLILTSFGVGNKDPALVQLQKSHGVDAFMIMDDVESSTQAAHSGVGGSTLTSPMTTASSPKAGGGARGTLTSTGLGISLMSNTGGATSSSWNDRRSGSNGAADIEKGVLRYNGVDSTSSSFRL